VLWVSLLCVFAQNTNFKPGATWYDVDGKAIAAHGGGVLFASGTYYWYGEAMDPNTLGVTCYSSKDLLNWKSHGIVLSTSNISSQGGYIIERPKVIYNDNSKQFVMWMHVDTSDYSYAHAGVATSNSPTGPFTFLYSVLPNNQESRDMTVYKDTNGTAYIIRSAGHTNVNIMISALSSDYLQVGAVASTIQQSREGPAILKSGSTYYLILSHCTGWSPNAADLWTASSLSGPWKEIGNPTDSDTTYNSQSTFFITLPAPYVGNYIFMGDRWNYPNLSNATYVWLPVFINSGVMHIPWYDQWNLSVFS